jgi:hypothetical protein
MWVSLTTVSGNAKVGPIPVSTTEEKSCPKECSLNGNDCYARFGPLSIHWKKVGSGRGDNWDSFCKRVGKFLKNQLWRHNQAGDLPQDENGKIDKKKCEKLLKASSHTRGWTYTHYNPFDSHNQKIIKKMNKSSGMTVNLSSDNVSQADEFFKLGIAPVVTILPENCEKTGNFTPGGIPIVICPAQKVENMNCATCKLCQVKNRKSIVGFIAHGTAKKRLTSKLLNGL